MNFADDYVLNDMNADLDLFNNGLTDAEYWLTTIDNPFNPFEKFEDWEQFDRIKGYNSLGFIGRIVYLNDEIMSEEDYNTNLNIAIDEIVKRDCSGLYIKVTKDFYNDKEKIKKLNKIAYETIE